jgi:ABC-type sulfate transport system permease component
MKTKIVAPDRVAQPTRSWPTHLVSRNMVSDIPFALPAIVAGLVLLSLDGPSSPLGSTAPNPPA